MKKDLKDLRLTPELIGTITKKMIKVIKIHGFSEKESIAVILVVADQLDAYYGITQKPGDG